MSQPGGCHAAHERLTYFTRARNGPTVTCAAGRALRAGGDDGSGACNGLDHRRYGLPEAGHALRGRATTVFGHNRQDRNCQVAASLTIATRTEHVPVDFALYLPESWTEDPSRRAEATSPTR